MPPSALMTALNPESETSDFLDQVFYEMYGEDHSDVFQREQREWCRHGDSPDGVDYDPVIGKWDYRGDDSPSWFST